MPLPGPDLAYVVGRHDRAALGRHLDALAHGAPFVRGDQPNRPFLDLHVVGEGPVTGREDSEVGMPSRHMPQPEKAVSFRAEPKGFLHAMRIDGGGMGRG
jgi:hypothetical protein